MYQQTRAEETELLGAFPGAIAIMPTIIDAELQLYFDEVGFASSDILFGDSGTDHVVYSIRETSTTAKLQTIWQREQAGELPTGTYDDALSALAQGMYI